MYRCTLIALLLCFAYIAPAQIFGGIMKEAKRKLERKVTDKIVDAVSDELARRAFKPIDEAIDSMMRQKYQDSINGGKPVDWEKVGQAYGDFLAGMNKAVNLPEKYTFDVTQEIEITDYDKKTNSIKLHYSKKDTIIGMENIDDNESKQFIVMDIARDAMVMYTTDKNGKKTAQTIPSVLGLTSAFVQNSAAEKETKNKFSISKTGKNKKVAGLQSEEYKGGTEEEDVVMYVTKNFPINTEKQFSSFVSRFAPASYTENSQNLEGGVMMEYENKRKDGKEKTTWVTKKVVEKSFELVQKDYIFGTAGN